MSAISLFIPSINDLPPHQDPAKAIRSHSNGAVLRKLKPAFRNNKTALNSHPNLPVFHQDFLFTRFELGKV
jgi:hypothetical protein